MAAENVPHFADLLRQARIAAGLTQEELAEAAGISVDALSNFERGINRRPDRNTLNLMADALCLPDDVRSMWLESCRHENKTTIGSSKPPEHDDPYSVATPLTSLLGRDADIDDIVDRLRDPRVRLLTLTGPGGVGKTRLALAVAGKLAADFPDGVQVVGLAPVRDSDRVISAIASVLNVQEPGTESLQTKLIASLQSKRLLLVLDNFEHVLNAAPLVTRLLSDCSMLTILATSRAPLRLQGEHEIEVSPLTLPEAFSAAVNDLLRSPAVALFVERAKMIRADFRLAEDNGSEVTGICARLDGLPLAIELAAARVKTLTPRSLLARLDRPLALLSDGSRDAPARQQTIRRTIAWSFDLLSPDEQRILRQLSVFAGGWTLEAAEDVCDPDLDVFTGLSTLVDHSLVRQREQADGSARFGMLETVREFAFERLTKLGEDQRCQERHAAYFARLAEETRPALKSGSEQRQLLEQLESELDNLRAALTWLIGENDAERAHRLVAALDEFWNVRGRYQEASEWIKMVISLPGEVSSNVKADALSSLGYQLAELGAYDESFDAYERAVELYRETNNSTGLAQAYCDAGFLALYRGQYSRSTELHERSLEIARTNDDLYGLSRSLAGLSAVTGVNGDFQRGMALAEEFLAVSCEIGDEIGRAVALSYLGYSALWRGDLESAYQRAQDCIAVTRELGEISWLGFGTRLLAHIESQRGEYQSAEQHYCESLRGARARRELMVIAEGLEGLAGTAVGLGNSERAARLLGSAASLRERVGTPIPPPQVERFNQIVAAARHGLGDSAFERLKAEGGSWPLDRAIDYALEETPAIRQSIEHSSALVAGLSRREIEVLRLLVEGLSDREIAEHLYISHHTAMRHVSNILRKLDVNSRTVAAAWAVRNGLV